MARRKRWNKLMEPSLADRPMPLRPKLDARWKRKVMEAGCFDELAAEGVFESARSQLWKSAAAAIVRIGQNQTALLLLRMAEDIALPPRDGRPPGAISRYTADADLPLLNAIVRLDDGSPGARGRAIAKVALAVHPDNRETLKRRLRRKLATAKPGGSTDKK